MDNIGSAGRKVKWLRCWGASWIWSLARSISSAERSCQGFWWVDDVATVFSARLRGSMGMVGSWPWDEEGRRPFSKAVEREMVGRSESLRADPAVLL